ncbi:MAG TPA: hypothetical protein VH744_07305 [Terriglobales bacterium]
MSTRKIILPLLCVLIAVPAWGRVLLRWTQTLVPPPETLGVSDLVVPFDATAVLENARRQGYHVYVETTLQNASTVAEVGNKEGLAGIILRVAHADADEADTVLQSLRSAYPKQLFLVSSADGKQPQMQGQVLSLRDGILQISSATAQPWLDTNLAMLRFDQTFRSEQTPIYGFQWDLADPLLEKLGPQEADYSLAVAEAGAFQADLILDVHDRLQRALAQDDPQAWTTWKDVKRYVDFYSPRSRQETHFPVNVGVVTEDYQTSYEPTNLMARHNIPFRILRSADLGLDTLKKFDVLVLLASLDKRAGTAIAVFAARGGVALLVDSQGSYPWHSAKPVRRNEHSVTYAVGTGRVIELTEPMADPEAFAQDVRRLIDNRKIAISLWNALTTVAVAYRAQSGSETTVELLNYAAEPLPVQVRVKGAFTSIQYETPERGCCESLKPVQRDGYTEFVVPWLRIGGRVHLQTGGPEH